MSDTPRCPICEEVWQSILQLEDSLLFWHYCVKAQCYIGWDVRGVPYRIPSESIYQNPPRAGDC